MEIMKSRQHPSTICSIKMQPEPKPAYYIAPWTTTLEGGHPDHPLIMVRLSFRHWRELHHLCPNTLSPSLHDHNTLTKELVETGFGGTLVFPLDPATLAFRVEIAEVVQGGLPEFVTPGVWRYVKEKLTDYLLEHVDFDDDQGLGFEMSVAVDVSTAVDAFDDDGFFYDDGDYYEVDDDDDHKGTEDSDEDDDWKSASSFFDDDE